MVGGWGVSVSPWRSRGGVGGVGEFLGDQELLIVAVDGQPTGVLVGLPLDPRADWYRVGSSLSDFPGDYLAAVGEKFWE